MKHKGKFGRLLTFLRQCFQEFQHQARHTFHIKREGNYSTFIVDESLLCRVPFLAAGEVVKFPSDASLFQAFGEDVDDFVGITVFLHSWAAVDDNDMSWFRVWS